MDWLGLGCLLAAKLALSFYGNASLRIFLDCGFSLVTHALHQFPVSYRKAALGSSSRKGCRVAGLVFWEDMISPLALKGYCDLTAAWFISSAKNDSATIKNENLNNNKNQQHLQIFVIMIHLICAAHFDLMITRLIRSFPQSLTLSHHRPVAWPPCQKVTGLSTQTQRVTLRQSSAGPQGTVLSTQDAVSVKPLYIPVVSTGYMC